MLTLTSWQKYLGVREATQQEAATYEAIEAMLETFTDDEFDKLVEACSEYAFSYGPGRKAAYKKVWRMAHNLWVSVSDLMTWYCVEPA